MKARWTASQIVDQSGKLAVVTGANGGLGRITAIELARHGAELVLATRSAEAGASIAEEIIALTRACTPRVRQLDLANLDSVHRFANEFADERVDLLVNNAGVMMTPRRRTAQGFELQLGTNHLGHFALTGLLLRAIERAPAGRIVTVSSNEHRGGRIGFDDLALDRGYSPRAAYQRSKLANALFAVELDRRLRAGQSSALSVFCHPGYAATNLQRSGPTGLLRAVLAVTNVLVAQSPAHGALPILYAATAREVAGGGYYGPDGWHEMCGFPTRVRAAAAAYDPQLGRRLWEASEQLTGVRYDLQAMPEAIEGSA